jgi:hypothetical protein
MNNIEEYNEKCNLVVVGVEWMDCYEFSVMTATNHSVASNNSAVCLIYPVCIATCSVPGHYNDENDDQSGLLGLCAHCLCN